MTEQIAHSCARHVDPADCPDALVAYSEAYDEYGIRVHDGGSSVVNIRFCPWCGAKLPASRRDEWFEKLEALGVSDPAEQDIPIEFTTDAWYRGA